MSPTRTEDRGPALIGQGTLHGQAFGLRIEANFPMAGLRGGSYRDHRRSVSLQLVSDTELRKAWPPAEAREDRRLLGTFGETSVLTECHPNAGYLVQAPGYGRHLIDLDGRRIRSAPEPIAPERWQGLLAVQALPLAATLQGLEVFRASAVVIAGEVVALIGPSGCGKSTLATHLMLLGARFFADDAVALEACGQHVVAHAGLGILRLRLQARAAAFSLAAQRMATVIGKDDKTLVELERDVATLSLRSLYLLDAAQEVTSSPIASSAPDPRRLLASTYNLSVRTPERLRRQLEFVSLLGRGTRMFTAHVQRHAEPETARAVFEHAAREVLA